VTDELATNLGVCGRRGKLPSIWFKAAKKLLIFADFAILPVFDYCGKRFRSFAALRLKDRKQPPSCEQFVMVGASQARISPPNFWAIWNTK